MLLISAGVPIEGEVFLHREIIGGKERKGGNNWKRGGMLGHGGKGENVPYFYTSSKRTTGFQAT